MGKGEGIFTYTDLPRVRMTLEAEKTVLASGAAAEG